MIGNIHFAGPAIVPQHGITLMEPRMTEEELLAFLLAKGGGRG
jgi:hypothetical protein